MKARQFDKKFDAGEDVTAHLDLAKARRAGLEQKRVHDTSAADGRHLPKRRPLITDGRSRLRVVHLDDQSPKVTTELVDRLRDDIP